jgi:Gpi18-like mannosyltransferase
VPEPPAESEYSDVSSYGYPAPGLAPQQFAGRAHARGGRPVRERGIPGWAAVLLLLLIAGVGGVIDQISGASIQGAFNWALIVASLVAILVVRRRQMFPVVIAPPLVYFIASAAKLYFSSNGLKDRAALTDAAANWLVYGFPAIAGATAVVLVVAGVRMIGRR